MSSRNVYSRSAKTAAINKIAAVASEWFQDEAASSARRARLGKRRRSSAAPTAAAASTAEPVPDIRSIPTWEFAATRSKEYTAACLNTYFELATYKSITVDVIEQLALTMIANPTMLIGSPVLAYTIQEKMSSFIADIDEKHPAIPVERRRILQNIFSICRSIASIYSRFSNFDATFYANSGVIAAQLATLTK